MRNDANRPAAPAETLLARAEIGDVRSHVRFGVKPTWQIQEYSSELEIDERLHLDARVEQQRERQ
jgi:lipopolysaccharide/colanic/teichoic acid biosynthesis glycosyltransferase